ncbi:MAG: O-methyltransferase [Saprospiraceae bacterium]
MKQSLNSQSYRHLVQKLQFLLRFLRFFWRAQTSYRLHSPFIFEFAAEILDDRRIYYAFSPLEKLRQGLLKNHNKLTITDHGAGSRVNDSNQRSIRQITSYSVSSPFFCRVLFKVINKYQPLRSLELGTSVGVSSLYQAAGLGTNGKLITLEGCPQIASIAQQNFAHFSAYPIDLRIGTFSETLIPALQDLEGLDYVFIDGNHRLKPTVEYFETCLQYAHENSIFVFDDIHWSKEMEAAWQQVQQHPKVTLTIDLFSCGLVFLRTEHKTKMHYQLVPNRWKPWQMGFFRAR